MITSPDEKYNGSRVQTAKKFALVQKASLLIQLKWLHFHFWCLNLPYKGTIMPIYSMKRNKSQSKRYFSSNIFLMVVSLGWQILVKMVCLDLSFLVK